MAARGHQGVRADSMKKSLQVLHVISGIDRADGGPTLALLGLARGLARLHVEVSVVATPRASECDSIEEDLRECGVRVRLGEFRGRALGQSSVLRELLTKEIGRADVVHIHALWEEVQRQAATISRQRRTPFVVRPCGLLDPWSMAQHRLKKRLYLELRLRRCLNAASAMHFSTSMEEERARALRIQAPAIIEPNGIDFDEFQNPPPPGSFRRRSNIDEGVPVVLFLGRMHPKKGLDLLIPAFAKGAPSNAVLAIVGSGDADYEAELRRLVSALGIERRVKFAGFLRGQDRVAAYADSNLFVLPSYSENFANTVLESLAAGTPVIVSDQVGLHAEVDSSMVGGVVPVTLDALTEEIRRWLIDAQRRDLARARAAKFLKPYDVNCVANRWLQRYREFTCPASGEAA